MSDIIKESIKIQRLISEMHITPNHISIDSESEHLGLNLVAFTLSASMFGFIVNYATSSPPLTLIHSVLTSVVVVIFFGILGFIANAFTKKITINGKKTPSTMMVSNNWASYWIVLFFTSLFFYLIIYAFSYLIVGEDFVTHYFLHYAEDNTKYIGFMQFLMVAAGVLFAMAFIYFSCKSRLALKGNYRNILLAASVPLMALSVYISLFIIPYLLAGSF